jgi:hypothetical protein
MRKAIWLIAGLLSCCFQSYKAFSQNVKPESEFTGAFYNVENLFDTINHPDFRDDDFTPLGSKSWNSYRYWAKLKRISQVLTNAGQWNGLSIIGLCEIENRNVLIDLVSKTSLKKYDYRIVHEDSKDERGIDVALLFKASRFQYQWHRSISVALPNDNKTRDILAVKGMINNEIPLLIMVNHWPSRWGGKIKTSALRLQASETLKKSIVAIRDSLPATNLLIMGDFNDTPEDLSLKSLFRFLSENYDYHQISIANNSKVEGTIYHKDGNFGGWQLFDQVVLAQPKNVKEKLHWKYSEIYGQDWLLDDRLTRPYRSYQGPVYLGGYSDHLPVVFKLEVISGH